MFALYPGKSQNTNTTSSWTIHEQSRPALKSLHSQSELSALSLFITALHNIKQSMNRWRFSFQIVGVEFIITSQEVSFSRSFLVVCKNCTSDVSDLWLLRTFAFDDLVICCHYKIICIKYETIQQPQRSLSSEFEFVLTK